MELPSEDTLRFIVARFAHMRAEYGDAIGTPDLVLPTATFFPDEFTASPAGVGALLKRTLGYAPVAEDVDLELAFTEPDQQSSGGGCSSGACGTDGKGGALPLGTAQELEDGGYRVFVRVTDVGNPTLLTSSLARSAGAIVLSEAGEEVDPSEHGVMSELAATSIGLGLLLVNGSCVYMKSCGGLRAHEGTHMSVSELCVALALFLRVHGQKPSAARSHMETTQREAFDEALRWVDSNEALIVALRTHPETLTDGVFAIEEARGLLGRLFAKKPVVTLPTESELRAAPRKAKSEAEMQRLKETRALVEEALREG